MEASGSGFHRRKHKKEPEENIPLSTMKSPISAKERTKSRFDQLLKTALEEAKLKPQLTNNKTRKVTISNNNDEEETELKTSEIMKLTKQKKLKDDKLGLLNPVYEDDDSVISKGATKFAFNRNIEEDNNNWKQLKETKNASKCSIIEMEEFPMEKPKKKPRTKQRKSKGTLNGFNGHHPQIVQSSLVNGNDELTSSRNYEKKDFLSGDNELKTGVLHHVVRAEVYNGSGSSSLLSGDVETEGSVGSTPSRSAKRQNRRRHKQLVEEKDSTKSLQVSNSEPALDDDDDDDVVHLRSVSKNNDLLVTDAQVQKLNKSDVVERISDKNESLEKSNILEITVHRVDRLKMNHKIKHPLVRIHIIDGNTGTYLKKSNKDKVVTTVYENQNSNVDFIMSVMTQPCELKHNKCIYPIWEESLIFNENFEHFVRSDSNVIVFFEVLDFLPMATVTSQQSKYSHEGGWYRIAWAFLKIVGANNVLNTGRKIRLQLYYPPKQRIRPEPRVLDVYHWWSQLPRIPYPSTMFVTLNSLSPPNNLPPTMRSMAPMQLERGKNSIEWLGSSSSSSKNETRVEAQVTTDSPQKSSIISTTTQQWSRLPGQTCKVPNKQIQSLATDKKGCFVAKFSYNGKFIACGCQSDKTSYILIYEIPSGGLVSKLQGHSGLIYDLNWTKNDCSLLSASADGTARIWSPFKKNSCECCMLPHPSFVYCAEYHPSIQCIVATGCYDNLVRVWNIKESEQNPQLTQEVEMHNGHVNSICFTNDGNKLFSGDSLGVVCIWNVSAVTKQPNGGTTNLTLCHEIKEPQLKGFPINTLVHHPNLHRIIIQTRDGTIRMLDYEKMQFVQSYKGFLNLCEHLRSCISPCGTLVFTGSEDGYVYVWNSITGDVVATYSTLPYHQTVHCVLYHPHDHLVAFCYHGNKNAVVVYKYDFQFAPLQVNQVQPQITERNRLASNQMLTSTPQSHFGKRTVSFGLKDKEVLPSLSGGTTALEKIIKKLDSVLETRSTRSQEMSHGSEPSSKSLNASIANSTILSWNTTFESTAFSNCDTNENLRAMAQYDYIAQRSDELTFKNGDLINIVKTESDQWLVGRSTDGKQGYVPANYVIIMDNNNETISENEKQTDVTAVLTKSGQLTFISDSDSD